MSKLYNKRIWRNYPPYLNVEKENGVLHDLTESLLKAVDQGVMDLEAAEKMMYILTATGKWLDKFGDMYDIYRLTGEEDDDYRERILWEITRPKQTLQGLREVISFYGSIEDTPIEPEAIDTFEPFYALAPLDEGCEADNTRIYDMSYWTWGVVDIRMPFFPSEDIKYRTNQTKAAGVCLYFSATFEDDVDMYIERPVSTEDIFSSIIDVPSHAVYITDTYGYTDKILRE